MPAAAVIPAPIAYINVVAVKKLVVGYLAFALTTRPLLGCVLETWVYLPVGGCSLYCGAVRDPDRLL